MSEDTYMIKSKHWLEEKKGPKNIRRGWTSVCGKANDLLKWAPQSCWSHQGTMTFGYCCSAAVSLRNSRESTGESMKKDWGPMEEPVVKRTRQTQNLLRALSKAAVRQGTVGAQRGVWVRRANKKGLLKNSSRLRHMPTTQHKCLAHKSNS